MRARRSPQRQPGPDGNPAMNDHTSSTAPAGLSVGLAAGPVVTARPLAPDRRTAQ
jgi:hypothetical protein